jgi:predicted glycoside hydrolase/deacetylase ChbG (UPF0249 family)
MTTQRSIIINADDVGMHPAIDGAVLRLAQSGAISSVSVMALMRPDVDTLHALRHQGVDLGLHLDFTSTIAAQHYALPRGVGAILAHSYMRRLSLQQACNIVDEQLQRFCELTGSMPAFIDGHEHVHQFPVIRDALLQAVARQAQHLRPFIRSTRPLRWRGMKARVIGWLGAAALETAAHDMGCNCNTDFFGVYPLQKEVRLDHLWHRWLQAMPPHGALVMCHPAISEISPGDVFRLREYRFLSSGAFVDMLNQYNTRVTGWRAALGETAPKSAAFCPG